MKTKVVALLAVLVPALLIMLPIHGPLQAEGVWYVTPAGDDGDDCLSPATPCRTISGSLAKASSGDTILVASGVYTATLPTITTISATGESMLETDETHTGAMAQGKLLLIDKDVILAGGYDQEFGSQIGQTVLDGEGMPEGVVVNEGVTAVIDRFTIQNCCSAEPIYDGIALVNGGTLTLNRVHVRNNLVRGIENSGDLMLNQSAVTDNGSVEACGGGIYSSYGTLIVNNSTVSGNASSSKYCAPLAGIMNHSGLLYLNSSTVANNNGGGVRSYPAGSATLQNTIVAGNTVDDGTPEDCSETEILSSGYNFIGAAQCPFNSTDGDQVGSPEAPIDPGLVAVKGTPAFWPLKANSPAVDAGNPAGCADHLNNPLLHDQRGVPRLGRCDIGSAERFALDKSQVTVDPSRAVGGDEVSFRIELKNTSDLDMPGTGVVDLLPVQVTYAPGTLSASSGEATFSGQTVRWTGTVPAHSQVFISYGAVVSELVDLGTSLVNEIEVRGENWSYLLEATLLVDAKLCGVTKYSENPVLEEGTSGSWDDDGVWGPAVIKHEGSYMMWYNGRSSSGTTQIGMATSDDGIHWDKSPTNPVLVPTEHWEANGIGHPTVVFQGKFRMWYTGYSSKGVGRIGYAVSSDGISWSKYGGNPVIRIGLGGRWDDAGVAQPTVVYHDLTYHLWYAGFDGLTSRIGYASSTDGSSWMKSDSNPALDIGQGGAWDWLHVYDPYAIQIGPTYRLFYDGDTLPAATHIGYSSGNLGDSCANGVPFIGIGGQGSFDDEDISDISVLADGDAYRAWYAGYDGDHWRVGLASLNTCAVANRIFLPQLSAPPGSNCWPYYVETFSDPASGWYIDANDDREFAYLDGTYRVLIKKPESGWGVTAGAKAKDFTLAVDARKASGMGSYGVRFAINQNWTRFYDIYLYDQYFSIWYYDEQFPRHWSMIVNWTENLAINPGESWNHIEVMRAGSGISVSVNGVPIAEVIDAQLVALGRIGFVVSSASGSMIDARFDNFKLYPATCGG